MGYHSDKVTLTASPRICTVPVIWDDASRSDVVWIYPMHTGLGLARSGLSLYRAYSRLKKRGARLCNAAEKRLLRTLPDHASQNG